MKNKLFISQPMRNKTDEEIVSERENAISYVEQVLGEEVEVLDSFFLSPCMNALECLGKAIMVLSKADVVYFVKGWETARGCRIERLCAEQYGIGQMMILEEK